jgi:hypothetical protein
LKLAALRYRLNAEDEAFVGVDKRKAVAQRRAYSSIPFPDANPAARKRLLPQLANAGPFGGHALAAFMAGLPSMKEAM